MYLAGQHTGATLPRICSLYWYYTYHIILLLLSEVSIKSALLSFQFPRFDVHFHLLMSWKRWHNAVFLAIRTLVKNCQHPESFWTILTFLKRLYDHDQPVTPKMAIQDSSSMNTSPGQEFLSGTYRTSQNKRKGNILQTKTKATKTQYLGLRFGYWQFLTRWRHQYVMQSIITSPKNEKDPCLSALFFTHVLTT